MNLGPNLNPVKLESGHLQEAGYDEVSETMYIRFSNNSIYTYSPVPKNKYLDMVNATSAGSYFHKHIKNDKKIICKPLR